MRAAAAKDYAASVAADVAARYGVTVAKSVRVTICPPMTFSPPPEAVGPANGVRRGWQRANEAKRANEARAARLRRADDAPQVSAEQQAAFEADQARRVLVAALVAEGLSLGDIIARVGLKEATLRAWAAGVGIALPSRRKRRVVAPASAPKPAAAPKARPGSQFAGLVRDLVAKGHTKAEILRETGMSLSGLDKLLARSGLKAAPAHRRVTGAVEVRRAMLAQWLAEGLSDVEAVDRLKAEAGVCEKSARRDMRAIGRVLRRPTLRGKVPRTAPPEIHALRQRERAALREAVALGVTVERLTEVARMQHAVLERHIAALRAEIGASAARRFPALALYGADGDALILWARRGGMTYHQIQRQTGYGADRISAVIKAAGLAAGVAK